DLKITQKSAWFVLHRLRYAARTKSFDKPLKGEIEIDETFLGGKERNKHARKRKHLGTGGTGKTAVVGMLERGGELRTMKMDTLNARSVQTKIAEHVEPGSNIMTDEWSGYRGLGMQYYHHTVSHSAGEYVKHYFAHVNGLEGA